MGLLQRLQDSVVWNFEKEIDIMLLSRMAERLSQLYFQQISLVRRFLSWYAPYELVSHKEINCCCSSSSDYFIIIIS